MAAAPATAPVAPRPVAPGRIVPPTLRLRIEEQRPTTPTAPLPTTPAPRTVQRPIAPPRPVPPAVARPAAAPAGTPGARTPSSLPRPGGAPAARPPYPSQRPPVGGPRPLPSQPIRPQQPGIPPRPGQYPQRPGMPSRPSYQQRPGGAARPAAGRRDHTARPAPPPMPAAPPPVTKTITLAEGMTVKDLADKLDIRVKEVLAKLLMKRLMLTINSALDTETATMIAREFGADVQMQSFEEELLQADEGESRKEKISSPARRSSPSWVTWTTERRACSTRSAPRASRNARLAVSPSTSARITSRLADATSCSSTRPVTRRSRSCGPEAPRSPTSSSWWSRLTMMDHAADEGKRSTTHGRRKCRLWWRSTRSTRPTPAPRR